jgi:hypothetical protein
MGRVCMCVECSGWASEQGVTAVHASYAALIHYPECWDVAAYPTLDSAVREVLAWAGCNVCKNPDSYGVTPNVGAKAQAPVLRRLSPLSDGLGFTGGAPTKDEDG